MLRHLLLFKGRKLHHVKSDSLFLRSLSNARYQILTEIRYKYRHNRDKSNSNNSKTNNGKSFLGLATLAAAIPLASNPNENFTQPPQQQLPPIVNFNQPQLDIHISWNDFCYQMLAKGEVERLIIKPDLNIVRVILHEGAIVNGRRPLIRQYLLQVPSLELFEHKLREFEKSIGIETGNEVPIIYERGNALPTIIGLLVFGSILYLLRKNVKIAGPQSILSGFSKAKFTLVDPTTRAADTTSIKFKDVAGLKEAKVEVMEFVDYLKNSERFLKLGAKLPKGVLLLGPPGCGKTLLAKAVATEANVPFLALAGSDFVEMIGGVGASRVRSLFKSANKLAPCIIYIDEIDSIGKKRSGGQFYNGEMEQTLNQLLVEMDGIVTRKGVILLASTNRAEVLDQALLRPGRFDRQIYIDYPNLEERKEIFEKHSSKIKLDNPTDELAYRIAQLTPGMSGADLANVCNEAALHAARKDKKSVASDDLEYAIERVVGGTEKRSSSISPTERRIIAYHESGHALVGWLLEHTDPILKVSIVPRTTNILGFAQYLPSDRKLHNQEQFLDKMCMALGGRVAELIKFNHLSTGAQDDLRRVTEIAMSQIKEYGFDPVVGHLSFPKQDPQDMGEKPYSKRLANVIDQRASMLVRTAFEKTQQLLNANMEKLNLLAETLIAKEVMNSSDIEKLIGPPTFAKKDTSSSYPSSSSKPQT